jgi:hypothetical protein
MRDLPAPQHSDALNAMVGLPPADLPGPNSPTPVDAVPRLEAQQHRQHLRRRAVARARARRDAA